MNKLLPILLFVAILAALGYVLVTKPKNMQDLLTGLAPAKSEYTVVLSEQNGSKQSGTATLTEENGKVKVILNLTGAPQGVTQPAHIHVGACPDLGAIKYPLASAVNGMSETVVDVTFEKLRSELPLGINIHKSVPQSSVYVSCGDLAF